MILKKLLFSILLISTFISCTNYGEKLTFNGTDVYYKNNVTEQQAKQLGEYLIKKGFANGDKKSVQFIIDPDTNNLTFKMIVDENILEDPSYDYVFKTFARNLSDEFKTSVDFHLCDDTFHTLKVYLFSDLPKSLNAKATEILYTKNITESEGIALRDFLIKSGFSDDENPKTVEFDKKDEIYLFRMVIKEGLENDENTINNLKLFGEEISSKAFNNKALKIHMCNSNLETLQVIE
jgi:hypothetical protein